MQSDNTHSLSHSNSALCTLNSAPTPKTFYVQTLGCKVNHYESEQIATLLLSRGLTPADAASADIRIINTCSVTMQAASQSRQSVRRLVRLPVLSSTSASAAIQPAQPSQDSAARKSRVIVTGCWATSNSADASALPGVDAVVTHHQNVAKELDRLLKQWDEYATPVGQSTQDIEPKQSDAVNGKPGNLYAASRAVALNGLTPSPGTPGEGCDEGLVQHERRSPHPNPLPEYREREQDLSARRLPGADYREGGVRARSIGTTSLPLLGSRQPGRQRAFLKIQDGCDAHCTYCIIPSLRPTLWSKPIDAAVEEATALVAAGHVEIVLTGIFLGAYGQPTALRRRQPQSTAKPLGELIDALCTRVPGLRRLRLSSLEPGDLTDELLAVLRSHRQVVPHFHLPLQSGSDALLRRMNRQYTRDDFVKMIDRVKASFDRPALTTDVVVGFPGETDGEFERTAESVRAAGFIHVHAFPYSPRPGTAAARWTRQYVRGPIVNERIERLREMAAEQSFAFRSSFLGEIVEVIVEREAENGSAPTPARHGRCERYFPVTLDTPNLQPGDSVRAKISQVTRDQTMGQTVAPARPIPLEQT